MSDIFNWTPVETNIKPQICKPVLLTVYGYDKPVKGEWWTEWVITDDFDQEFDRSKGSRVIVLAWAHFPEIHHPN